MTSLNLKIIVDLCRKRCSGLETISNKLGGVAKLAGARPWGYPRLGRGMTGVGVAGLSMNNSMEKARARINAFTKDGAKTAKILEDNQNPGE